MKECLISLMENYKQWKKPAYNKELYKK
jgi:hypothetical protein